MSKHLKPTLVRAFLDVIPKSRIFTVTFTKKDGTSRVMNCRRDVRKHLKGGESTIADKPNLVSVYEMGGGYRCFDIRRVRTISGAGAVLETIY